MGRVVPVTAAGGVIFDDDTAGEVRILLIRRRGVWDLPKGKLEEGESVEECACREAAEEVGCPLPKAFDIVTQTYHEYEEYGERIGKTTYWFPMVTSITEGFTPERKEGIVEVRWSPPGEAKKLVGYDNLKRVIDHFESWHKKRRAQPE